MHLKDDASDEVGPLLLTEWRPATYSDFDVVIEEAVADVTRDAEAVCCLPGLPPAPTSDERAASVFQRSDKLVPRFELPPLNFGF
jgi:hypothetical protein